jgi:solute carrier family 25 (adenine nucleotide translocator) protein 4/5/6/31
VLRYFPTQAFNFAFKDYFRTFFCPYDSKKDPWKFFYGNLISGGLAGGLSVLIVYPLDFIRTRLGADILDASKAPNTKKRQFKGSIDCFVKIYRSEGIKGVYSGCMLSALMYFFYRAIYFGGYDTIKQIYGLEQRKSSIFLRLCVALLVTNSAGFLVFPLDTVRRRLMMQAGRTGEKTYNGSFDCIGKIWTLEGKKAFYKGGLSNVLRGSGSAFVLVIYDEIRKKWNKGKRS